MSEMRADKPQHTGNGSLSLTATARQSLVWHLKIMRFQDFYFSIFSPFPLSRGRRQLVLGWCPCVFFCVLTIWLPVKNQCSQTCLEPTTYCHPLSHLPGPAAPAPAWNLRCLPKGPSTSSPAPCQSAQREAGGTI